MKLLMGLALVAYVVCKWSSGRGALHSSGSLGQAGKLARFFCPREGSAGCFPLPSRRQHRRYCMQRGESITTTQGRRLGDVL